MWLKTDRGLLNLDRVRELRYVGSALYADNIPIFRSTNESVREAYLKDLEEKLRAIKPKF